MNNVKAVRYHEIDMLKGLACVLMLIGHAIRVQMGPPGTTDKIVLHIMDFSGPIFFFVSGMNVMTFLERNGAKPGFRATRFYLAAAALLFFLGFTYNLNRGSIGMMEIFQGVAMGTAFTYLLMRTKLPTWAHFVVMGVLYAVYLWFRVRLEVHADFAHFRELRAAIPLGTDIIAPGIVRAMQELGGRVGPLGRLLFVHFSLLPWVLFFYTGALCYRSLRANPARAKYWWIFFIALVAVSPFVGRKVFPQLFLATYMDLMLRGIPSYVSMTLGGAGIAYLLSRKLYRGAENYRRRTTRWVAAHLEMLGKESFMFLIVHWWVISTILGAVLIANHALGGETTWVLNVYVRALLVIIGTIFAVPWFAAVRDRWSRANHYGRKVAAAMIAGFILTVMVLPASAFWALYVSYVASFGFAFVYPTLRQRLRRRYTSAPTGD